LPIYTRLYMIIERGGGHSMTNDHEDLFDKGKQNEPNVKVERRKATSGCQDTRKV